MAIPVRRRDERVVDGLAAYLRVVGGEDHVVRGGLFVVDGRGEPVDFCFSDVEVRARRLWRAGASRRHAARELALVLCSACPREPDVLLVLEDEVPAAVFTEDIEVLIPHARIAHSASVPHDTAEEHESLSNDMHLFWVGGPPPDGSPARLLVDTLASRGMLREPFERVLAGLEEAFDG
ncbi:MAG TPA: hypothetical protein VNI78_00265 [Vicinamibacterales bacterium]|nr:hypothetical protein [Vicinamibacterales bacterium]